MAMTQLLRKGLQALGAREREAAEALVEALVVASEVRWKMCSGQGHGHVQAQAWAVESMEARPGQGVHVLHPTGPPDQADEDQVPGGELLFSLPTRESEIIDFFLGASL